MRGGGGGAGARCGGIGRGSRALVEEEPAGAGSGVGPQGRLPGVSRSTGAERGRLPAFRDAAESPVRPPGTGKRGGGVAWDKRGGEFPSCREKGAGRGSPEGPPGWGGVFPWGCPGPRRVRGCVWGGAYFLGAGWDRAAGLPPVGPVRMRGGVGCVFRGHP